MSRPQPGDPPTELRRAHRAWATKPRPPAVASAVASIVALLVLAVGIVAAPGAHGQGGTTSTSTTSTTSTTTGDDVGDEEGSEGTAGTALDDERPVPAGAGSVPFPSSTVAPIPFAETEPPLDLAALYAEPGSPADLPRIVVQFREPFDLPEDDYRVSVAVGDPTGRRLRSSLVVSDGVVSSSVEIGDGASFEQAARVPPPTFDPSGLVVVEVPVNEAPVGGAIWAEAAFDDAEGFSVSPYFSLDALLGRASEGKVAAAPFGRVAEAGGGPSSETATMPPGPRVTVVDNAIVLEATSATPNELLGQEVVSVSDYIRIAPDFNNEATITSYIRVDRTTGEITLIDALSQPPEDRTPPAASWVIEGLGDDPMGPGRVVLAMDAVAAALDLDLSGTGPALGLRREFVLEDGKTVTADAVLATLVWFDTNAVADPEIPTTTAPSEATATDAETPEWLLPAVIGGVAVVLILASAIVMIRRRRARKRGDAADVLVEMAAEAEERRTREHKAISVDDEPGGAEEEGASGAQLPLAAVRTGEVPVVPEAAPRLEVPDTPTPTEPKWGVRAGAAGGDVGDGGAGEGDAGEGDAGEGPTGLAALDAELDDLIGRLDRLGGSSPGDQAGGEAGGQAGGQAGPDAGSGEGPR